VADALPEEVFETFKGVDLILHAGDIYSLDVLDALEKIAPVLAARGDDDHGATIRDPRVKEKHSLQLEGKVVWLVHEKPYVPANSAFLSAWWQSRLDSRQNSLGKPDILVFGHEHRTFQREMDGTIMVSSGSPTFLHYLRGPGTVGIMELNGGPPEINIIRLNPAS